MSLWVCVFLNFFLSFSQDLQSPYLSPHNSLAVISFFCAPSDSVNHTPPPSFLPELFITCIHHEVPLNRENRDSSRDKSSSSPLSFTHPDIFCITHYRASHVSWICKCLQMCASALALKEASVFFSFFKVDCWFTLCCRQQKESLTFIQRKCCSSEVFSIFQKVIECDDRADMFSCYGCYCQTLRLFSAEPPSSSESSDFS